MSVGIQVALTYGPTMLHNAPTEFSMLYALSSQILFSRQKLYKFKFNRYK